MPLGAGRRTEREASTSSSESESSDGGIDDDSLLERMAAAARRSARRVARRSASGHRASRRVERHGGLPLATVQQRWDLAMTMPKARADGVRAYDDDSTRTGATRGGGVAQRKGGRIELPVAETVRHARSEVSGYSSRGAGGVRFGEDIAECGGGGGWRSTSPSPAGAKQAKAAHGGARPSGGERAQSAAAERVARSDEADRLGAERDDPGSEHIAECGGGGGWRSTSPSPAGAKQAKAAHGGAQPSGGEGAQNAAAERVARSDGADRPGAERDDPSSEHSAPVGDDADATRADCPPDSERGGLRFDARQHTVECQLNARRAFERTTRDRVAARRCGESARECLELAAKLRASHTDVERKAGNGGDSRGGGSDASVLPERVRGNHSTGDLWQGALDSVRSAEPSTQRDLHRSQSAFACRAARRAERFEAETAERGSSGSQLPTTRQPTSRVHRVADFAKWATQVAEASKADAAAASTTYDWREGRRRRRSAAYTAPTGEAKNDFMRVGVDQSTPRSATKARKEAGSATSASYPGDESLRRSYPGDEDGSRPGFQVGARERRTVPAGHGFRVSATVEDAADEGEQNDDEHRRRLREAAAPRARRPPELSDDEARKRRRSPTQDNGRRVLR